MPKVSASFHFSILCCLAWAAIAAYLANPHVAGVFHDDGIYLGCAKSLADGQGYRIPSLPGQPWQTKYPPLFSVLLTPVWWIEPNFPANIWIFQAVAIIWGFAFLLLSFQLFVKIFRFSERAALLLLAVLASNPLLLSVSGWILSELPYGALALTVLFFYETRVAFAAPATQLRCFILAALTASAYLVKTHGIVLVLAVITVAACEKRWRFLLKFLGFLFLLVAPWVAWALGHAGTGQTPLTDYYISYRDSISHFRTLHDVSQLASVAVQNVKYVAAFLDYFYFPVIPLKLNGSWLSIIGIGVLVGMVATWKLVSRLAVIYLAGFAALVLLLPWYPARHLIPVLPIILGTFWLGVQRLKESLDRLGGMASSFLKNPLARLAGWVLLALVLTQNMIFVSIAISQKSPGQIPTYLGVASGRSDWKWAGFQETVQWIQQNVPASEIIASQFDPLYYLYTGRQGIRFWFHNPRSYFYPDVSSATPFVGDASTVTPMLKQMKVRWLIREPAAGCCFAEWQGVDRLANSILQSGYPNATLAFVSADKGHWVYRLDW